MKRNMGLLDRVLRISVAFGFLLVILLRLVSGGTVFLFAVIASVLALQGITGVCPTYAILGISSIRTKRE